MASWRPQSSAHDALAGEKASLRDAIWLVDNREDEFDSFHDDIADRLSYCRKVIGGPRRHGHVVETDNAAVFAANTLPIISAVRAPGITDLR